MSRFLAPVFVAAALALVLPACGTENPERIDGEQPTTARGPSRIVGSVSVLRASHAVGRPLPPPFTITVPDAGRGGIEVPQAVSGGRAVSIVWEGGRPLPVTGNGGLELGPARLALEPDGLSWLLDGDTRTLLPGTYTFASTVAVGTAGLSDPRDRVTFTIDEPAPVTSHGGAHVRLSPAATRVEGSEGTLQMEGQLFVDDKPAHQVAFGQGIYEVELTPTDGGWQLVAVVEGQLAYR